MHEMGVVIQIVKTADSFARENGITKVKSLTVQIGEASAVLPRYVKLFFPEVVKDYPALHDCEIRTELVPIKLFCFDCGNSWYPGNGAAPDEEEFDIGDGPAHREADNSIRCPECSGAKYRFIEGKNIMVKEMEAV